MPSRQFSNHIVSWYQKNKRDLPWRKTQDPYQIWISEIMLQQTTVNAVIPYYQRWIKLFPDIKRLSRVRLQTVLAAWQGLGYYQRARNIKKTADIIVRDFNGCIPDSFDKLRQLPGFGPYTTGAVLSLAFHQRIAIVDANVRRVMMRLLAIQGKADTAHDQRIYQFLESLLPTRKNMSAFNQGLMELGAMICRSREPLCGMCPVRAHCQAYDLGIQEIIPEPQKKIIRRIEASVGIITYNEKFFIQQRPQTGLLAGLWEFPGGKFKSRETPMGALKREIREEVGAEITHAQKFMKLKHFYTQFCVHLHVYQCQVSNRITSNATRRWVSLKEMSKYPMASGSVKIVEQLKKG